METFYTLLETLKKVEAWSVGLVKIAIFALVNLMTVWTHAMHAGKAKNGTRNWKN